MGKETSKQKEIVGPGPKKASHPYMVLLRRRCFLTRQGERLNGRFDMSHLFPSFHRIFSPIAPKPLVDRSRKLLDVGLDHELFLSTSLAYPMIVIAKL